MPAPILNRIYHCRSCGRDVVPIAGREGIARVVAVAVFGLVSLLVLYLLGLSVTALVVGGIMILGVVLMKAPTSVLLCPSCGAQDSVAIRAEADEAQTPAPTNSFGRSERQCPWCAEAILTEAKICKHCGKSVNA